jgi:putative ABC transport system permease protein
MFPNSVFQYAFFEDSVRMQYQADERFLTTVLVFSLISLAIACLGLFALVSYNVEKRTKEIGIRKVLGASVFDIMTMFNGEFLKLIVISLFIAMPLGYYLLREWLSGFAYHISLSAIYFIAACGVVLLVAGIAASARSIKAASANPVKALQTE